MRREGEREEERRERGGERSEEVKGMRGEEETSDRI